MKTEMSLTGITEMQGVLQGYTARAAELQTTVFPAIVADFWRMEGERFASHGPGWAPLSPVTVQLKQRAGYAEPGSPLVATGALRDSLTGDTANTVHEVHPDSLTIGTNLPYAQYHQAGPRNIRVFGHAPAILPRRELVLLTEADALRWGEIVQRALSRAGAVTMAV